MFRNDISCIGPDDRHRWGSNYLRKTLLQSYDCYDRLDVFHDTEEHYVLIECESGYGCT